MYKLIETLNSTFLWCHSGFGRLKFRWVLCGRRGCRSSPIVARVRWCNTRGRQSRLFDGNGCDWSKPGRPKSSCSSRESDSGCSSSRKHSHSVQKVTFKTSFNFQVKIFKIIYDLKSEFLKYFQCKISCRTKPFSNSNNFHPLWHWMKKYQKDYLNLILFLLIIERINWVLITIKEYIKIFDLRNSFGFFSQIIFGRILGGILFDLSVHFFFERTMKNLLRGFRFHLIRLRSTVDQFA